MSDDALIQWLTKKIDVLENEMRELRARLSGEPMATPAASLPENIAPKKRQPLTPRELECAKLICQGLTSDAIASRMGIEYEGVRKHRQHIKAKVGVSELPELEERREEWDTSP